MKAKVDAIAAHGINCFVNRQLIYNYPESLLAEKGIMVIEHADFEGVERLSLVTGGEIASTFDSPEKVKLGHCELIEEIMIGEDKVRLLPCLRLAYTDVPPSSSNSPASLRARHAPSSSAARQTRWSTRPSAPSTTPSPYCPRRSRRRAPSSEAAARRCS